MLYRKLLFTNHPTISEIQPLVLSTIAINYFTIAIMLGISLYVDLRTSIKNYPLQGDEIRSTINTLASVRGEFQKIIDYNRL